MPCVEFSKNKMFLAVPKKRLCFRATLYDEWKLCVGATDWRTCQPFYPVRAEQHLFFSCWDPLNIIHTHRNVLLLLFGKQFRFVSVNTRVAYCVDIYNAVGIFRYIEEQRIIIRTVYGRLDENSARVSRASTIISA